MKCESPFWKGSLLFPCGQCDPCRINRKRVWKNRIILENTQHGSSSFWTLSYDDSNLRRTTSGLATLHREDFTKWLKRIRVAVQPVRLRFFGVGEYGDRTFRPHYHVALFGYGRCVRGQTLRDGRNRPVAHRCCENCRLVQSTWGLGDIHGGNLEDDSAGYLAGYVTKKMTRNDDARLQGRDPEFSAPSLKPGIGRDAMWEVASVLMQYDIETSEPDVPSALRHGSKNLPLGRYLKQQLRLMVGKEINAPEQVLAALAEQLHPLLESVREAKGHPLIKRAAIREAFSQEAMNAKAKGLIFKKRGTL